MDVLPMDEDEQYINHVYLIVVGWIIVTLLIGLLVSIPAL
jgi:hypothetical protein